MKTSMKYLLIMKIVTKLLVLKSFPNREKKHKVIALLLTVTKARTLETPSVRLPRDSSQKALFYMRRLSHKSLCKLLPWKPYHTRARALI